MRIEQLIRRIWGKLAISKAGFKGFSFYSKEFEMTIQEIEQAIPDLSLKELARFRGWFEEFDVQAWDEQFEQDAKSGKLDKLANKTIRDYPAGKAKGL